MYPGKILPLLVLALGGCSLSPASRTHDMASSPVLESLGAVSVFDTGVFSKYVYHGYADHSFWIDAAIRNDSSQKRVTLRWTGDDWATQKTHPLHFKSALDGRFEKWGTDVNVGSSYGFPYPEVRYVVRVEQNGVVSETPEMRLLYGVSLHKPVKLERSQLSVDATGHAVLSGSVATFPLPGTSAEVDILYSTDGWATSHTLRARSESTSSHAFRIDFPTSPDRIDFAVRLQRGRESFFDNNARQNYSHVVASDLQIQSAQADASKPLSGYSDMYCSMRTTLALANTEMRIDDSSWTLTDRVRVPAWQLADGTHRVSCRVTLEGGYQRTVERPLLVSNRISALDFSVMPALPRRNESEMIELGWALAADDAGRLTTLSGSGRVVRFASYSASLGEPEIFEDAQSNVPFLNVQAIASTPDGTVFGLGNRWGEAQVMKWNSHGKLARDFGGAGVVNLPAVDGKELCFADKIVADAKHIYISDSCGGSVLRLNATNGKALGTFAFLPQTGTEREQLGGMSLENGTLWVLGRGRIFGIDVQGEMKMMHEIAVTGLDLGNAKGLVHHAGKFFVLGSSPAALHVLDEAGRHEAVWFSPQFDPHHTGSDLVPGAFDIPAGPVLLSDGSLLVSSVQSPKIVRFSSRLKP